jgi:hypothetical protein
MGADIDDFLLHFHSPLKYAVREWPRGVSCPQLIGVLADESLTLGTGRLPLRGYVSARIE